MIISIIVALIIVDLIWTIQGYGYEAALSNCFIARALTVVTFVVILTIGYSFENAAVEKDYYGFLAVKETYELAVSDEEITGLERLEITKVAIEQNKALARKKVDMIKWYSFAITEENKQLILSLEPIAKGKREI